jgi:hypothetical protein
VLGVERWLPLGGLVPTSGRHTLATGVALAIAVADVW